MSKSDLKLLDCTLRDGGYINNWNWGFHKAKNIINSLCKAGIDIVEVGFLRNINGYNKDVTLCNTIEELNKLLPKNTGTTMFSAMAMRSNYDIDKLNPYSGNGIEMIRITAHDYDISDGMDFAREVKEKGYKLSINPINIMGYSDEQILWIVKQVNDIQPYQFSVVDTFGSMKRRDLDRIVSLVDNNLDRNIRLSLHLHENMALSSSLAQAFVDKNLKRPIAVDGSLLGMGRTPGNLPIELIADYLNDYAYKSYDIDYLMDAIQDYILNIKGSTEWGYSPAYFLSARFNLHRNYAEHYLNKGDLTHRDINHILARLDRSKATVFDVEYADKLYCDYKNNRIDDHKDREELKNQIGMNMVLILAPGMTLGTYSDMINEYIEKSNPIIISLNFIPEEYNVDYAFFSNNKRFTSVDNTSIKTIATSNLTEGKIDYLIDYNSLSVAFNEGCNSLIMLLKLLKSLDIESIVIAGADGYKLGGKNYYHSSINSVSEHDSKFNNAVSDAIKGLDIKVKFITPSAYEV